MHTRVCTHLPPLLPDSSYTQRGSVYRQQILHGIPLDVVRSVLVGSQWRQYVLLVLRSVLLVGYPQCTVPYCQDGISSQATPGDVATTTDVAAHDDDEFINHDAC